MAVVTDRFGNVEWTSRFEGGHSGPRLANGKHRLEYAMVTNRRNHDTTFDSIVVGRTEDGKRWEVRLFGESIEKFNTKTDAQIAAELLTEGI